jgi:uncharacterized Zn finger protein
MSWGGFAPYVSVAKKRAKASKKLKKLQKSNPAVRPVVIEGSSIARTWWGKSWNRNLERYADYENRIRRGRSYVRHGAVLDLQIRAGEATALVQGSRSQPYSVTIRIKELATSRWNHIKSTCAGKLASLPELLAGQFPRALGEIFMEEGKGLFPAPTEIHFSCSCPDWARLCKHVAAALYGVGARLDNDPGLFFTLRGVHVHELISAAVTDKTKDLLKKAEKKSRRVLEDVNLSDVFGIDLEAPGMGEVKIGGLGPASRQFAQQAQQSFTGASPPAGAEPAKTRAARPPAAGGAAKAGKAELWAKDLPPMEIIEKIIIKSRKGIDTAGIIKKTGLEAQQVRNHVQRLKVQGKIRTISRGVYGK